MSENIGVTEHECGGPGPRLVCGCHVDLPGLIRQAADDWIHVDGHGDAYAATEDRSTYALPICDPCYGAVGPYSAAWFSPRRSVFRCAGCLRYELTRGLGLQDTRG